MPRIIHTAHISSMPGWNEPTRSRGVDVTKNDSLSFVGNVDKDIREHERVYLQHGIGDHSPHFQTIDYRCGFFAACCCFFFLPHGHRTNARRHETFRHLHVLQLEDALEVERFKREAMQRRLDQQTKEAEEAHNHLQRENTLLNEQLAVRWGRFSE